MRLVWKKEAIRGLGCGALFATVVAGIPLTLMHLSYIRSGNHVYIHQSDPAIDAAIGRARASVGRFVKLLQYPPTDAEHFAIKARLTKGTEAEFVWVNRLTYSNGVFHGTVAEAPTIVTTVQKGDTIDVPAPKIADWIISYRNADGGVRYEGDEVNKVLLSRQGGHTLRYPTRQPAAPGKRTA